MNERCCSNVAQQFHQPNRTPICLPVRGPNPDVAEQSFGYRAVSTSKVVALTNESFAKPPVWRQRQAQNSFLMEQCLLHH